MKKFLAIDAVIIFILVAGGFFFLGQSWQKKQTPQTLSFLLSEPVLSVTGIVKSISDKELTLEATFNVLPPPPASGADKVEEVKQTVKIIRFAIDSSTTITQDEPIIPLLKPPANGPTSISSSEKVKTASDIKEGMTVTVYSTKDVRTADLGTAVTASNISLPDAKNRLYMRITKVNTNGTYVAEPTDADEALAKNYTINTTNATEYSQIDPLQGGVVLRTKNDIQAGKVYVVYSKEDANVTQSLTAQRIEILPDTPTPAPQAAAESASTLN